jgi:integrase
MFYVLILLLYTTGMRIGEALKLQLRDINQKDRTLYIRKTKFFKARAAPLSSSMIQELEDYLELRRRAGMPNNPESYLFHNPYRERPYEIRTIQHTYEDMLRRLGLKPPRGRGGPRLHDLRSTFAVHRLEEWYQQGIDVQASLGVLSTYLGHSNIRGTQRYLPMTTDLLQQASQRFNKYFKSEQKGEEKR